MEFIKTTFKKTVDFVNTVKTFLVLAFDKFVDRFKATNLYVYIKRRIRDYNRTHVLIKVASVAAAAFLMILVGFISSGATIAYTVNYDGQVIGTVSSKKTFTAAVKLVVNEIGNNAKGEISSPKYTAVLTLKNRLASKEDIKTAILENTDNIVYASLLKVDGKNIVYVSDDSLEQYLKDYCNSFNLKGCDSKSSFVETIEVQTGYFSTQELYTLDEAKDLIHQSVTVKTEATVASEEVIKFGTTTQKTVAQAVGYSQVIKAGVDGKRISTDSVIFINGVETERTNVSSEIVTQPVNQVVLVGTAKSSASAEQKAEISALGFVFPIDKSVRWGVSSYYGDGRNHKGIDLYAPKNTKIYAVAAGTVTYAGYHRDYGYMVIVNHANGTSTVYAHASSLCVSSGDSVVAGETIALVGSTGYSTGNHLHFEVRKNGVNVNPAAYIGLG